MPQAQQEVAQHDRLGSFLTSCTLEAVVPEDATNLDWISSLSAESPKPGRQTSNSLAPELKQRQIFFIDELVSLYVILRAPYLEEEAFTDFLSDLRITLETQVVGLAPPKPSATGRQDNAEKEAQSTTTLKDLVDTVTVDESEEPIVAVAGDNDDIDDDDDDGGEEATQNAVESNHTKVKEGKRCIFIIWKAQTHINHARINSSYPEIYFSASAQTRSGQQPSSKSRADEYLASGVPGSMNLLESLKNDPALADNPPVLTVTRLAKVIPAGSYGEGLLKPLRSSNRLLRRLAPALSSKIRFFGIGASPSQAKVLASLDVDIAPYTTGNVYLESVILKLSDGKADPITSRREISLPRTFHSRDSLSFLYNLLPDQSRYSQATKTGTHNLSLELSAVVIESGRSLATIKSSWKTSVNLSSFLRKPALLPPLTSNSSALPASTALLQEYLLTLTISGPPTVKVGEHLRWSLLFANRSTTRTLNLAVIAITYSTQAQASAPPITLSSSVGHTKKSAHRHKPTLSMSLFHPDSTNSNNSMIPAVTPAPGLIPLTADLRIGPLAPGASAPAEMRFLVLHAGVLSVEAIRVIDLDATAAVTEDTDSTRSNSEEKELKRPSTAGSRPGTAKSAQKSSEDDAKQKGSSALFVDVKYPMLPDVVALEVESDLKDAATIPATKVSDTNKSIES